MIRSWSEPFAAGRPYGQLYSSAASAATASSNSFAWLIRSTNVNRTWRRQQQQQRSCCGAADSAAAPLQTLPRQRQSFSLQNPPCKILQIQLVYATEYKRVALNMPSDAVRQHHAYRQFDVFAMVQCLISSLGWHCMSVRPSVRHIRKRWTAICRVQQCDVDRS